MHASSTPQTGSTENPATIPLLTVSALSQGTHYLPRFAALAPSRLNLPSAMPPMTRLVRAIALPFILGTVAGCDALMPGDCINLVEYRVTPPTRGIRVGESYTAALEVRGNVCSGKFSIVSNARWQSADTTVASVDSLSGRITGRRTGVTQIRASEGMIATVPVAEGEVTVR